MAITYKCRHCHIIIGKLDQASITEAMLGLDQLTDEQRSKMIQYKENGDMYIQSICEECENTLKQHPTYYELDFFIQ